MSWKPRFSVRQCLIGAVLMALLLTWTKNTTKFESVSLLRVHNLSQQNDYKTVQRKVVDDFTSQAVIDNAVASFESPNDQAAAARMLSTLKADYPGNSEILRISVTASGWQDSEEECNKAVDALCNSYLASAPAAPIQLIQTADVPGNNTRGITTLAWLLGFTILAFVFYGETLFAKIKRSLNVPVMATYAQTNTATGTAQALDVPAE